MNSIARIFGGSKVQPVRRSFKTYLVEAALLLLSAFLLALSFPGFAFKDGLGFLAFFALIPLFAVIRNTRWTAVWLYGFIYGFVFFWIFNFWLSAFHPLANLLVQIIKGTEMILLFLALKAADSWAPKKLSFVVQALVWVAYSYLSQSWFAGYPYGTIAYALFKYTVLIQIADFSGIWLLNFMIVLPQAFLGQWFCSRFSKTVYSRTVYKKAVDCPSLWDTIKSNRIVLIAYAALVLFQIVYGIITLSYWKGAEEDKSFSVAAVQHNADSWAGGYNTYKTNYNNLKRMSLEALQADPDMIIWSETAFVPSVDWYTNYPYTGDDKGATFDYLRAIQDLVDDFVSFGKSLGVPLLTGNPSGVLKAGCTEPYTEDGDWNKDDYNSVILFDNGEIAAQYLKQHLVPFTEHFPYENTFPALYNLLKNNDYHWWQPGTEPVVFETSNGIKFSSPICFEDVFGYLCADFVNNGADLLINMTNDSWSGSVAAERQHMAMAVFRSVENRRTTVRGTNSGITCLITPYGSVEGEMEPFKMGWTIYDVPIYTSETYGKTVYTRISDSVAVAFTVLAFLSLGASLAYTLYTSKKKK
ncbi:MAG: apolipoprotein N-acyltransferase [Sphaerochaetaceae bacterium]|nr:apolipoprotein N-acyltransferase [Sphaerochaetaceae bacterium]